VGFDRITIRPQPVGDLTWVKASYDSVRGRIASAWEITNGGIHLRVTIPVNATALVHVPATDASRITESGRSALNAPGVRFLHMEGKAAVFAIGSGDYDFRVE
jgi:alpha-L-rhamnosidase